MRKIITLLSIIYVAFSLNAEAKKIKLYNAIVTTVNKEKIQGIFYEINDSTIILAKFPPSKKINFLTAHLSNNDFEKIIIHYKEIKKISLFRLKRARFGKITGGLFLVGMSLGVLADATTPPPNPCCPTMRIPAIPILSILGLLISLPISGIAAIIPNELNLINRDIYEFRAAQFNLQNLSFVEKIKN